MRFLILRLLTHSELGFFHEYRRQGLEKAKQRAINFDGDVVDRVFPAAADSDAISIDLEYLGPGQSKKAQKQILKRQSKNWRLTGECIKESDYRFVRPGCLFVMDIDSGRKPAKGSWAVFPSDHNVAKSILSHSESSRLATSSMIALHGDEAQFSRTILSKNCPELFAASAKPSAAMKKNANSTSLVPDPVRLFDLLASVGYDLPSAVSDLIDNAIAADAKKVRIIFGEPDGGHGRWMAIQDDGRGMDRAGLLEAMRVGSRREYQANDLGKYGYGLKGASWSQAHRVSVVTKQSRGATNHLTWDRAHLEEAGEWEALEDALEPWERELVKLTDHGTAVVWANMRAPASAPSGKGITPHEQEIAELRRRVGLVFHRFLEGGAKGRSRVSIEINGVPVVANNPVGHELTKRYDRKDIRIPIADGKEARAQVQAFLIPTEDAVRAHSKSAGPRVIQEQLDTLRLWGRANESQGFFIYRCDRLISWGGWHDLFTPDEKTKLARITIDFDQALDDRLRVNISKRQVTLPQYLKEQLGDICKDPRNDSRKAYRMPKPKKTPINNPADSGEGQTENGNGTRRSDGNGSPSAKGGDGSAKSGVTTPEVRLVKTNKFIWRIQEGFGGHQTMEVNQAAVDLAELVSCVNGDSKAVLALVAFLKRLDETSVQAQLVALHK